MPRTSRTLGVEDRVARRWSTTRSATLVPSASARWASPVLQALRARQRERSEHCHGVQRPRRTGPPLVFYNRADEAGAQLKPGRLRLEGDLRRGRSLVPLAAASSRRSPDSTGELIIEGMKAAEGGRGDRVVRPELPGQALAALGGPSARLQVYRRKVVEHVDVLVGNERRSSAGPWHPRPGDGPDRRSSIPTASRA